MARKIIQIYNPNFNCIEFGTIRNQSRIWSDISARSPQGADSPSHTTCNLPASPSFSSLGLLRFLQKELCNQDRTSPTFIKTEKYGNKQIIAQPVRQSQIQEQEYEEILLQAVAVIENARNSVAKHVATPPPLACSEMVKK